MAAINVTIPDSIAPRVLDAIAARYGYDPDGGQTKAQFAQRQMKQWMREQLEWYEGSQAEQAARKAAVDAIREEMPDA